MAEKGDDLLGFALAKGGRDEREADEESSRQRSEARSGIEGLERDGRWLAPVIDVDGTVRGEREGAFVLVIGVLVGDGNGIAALFGGSWEWREMESQLLMSSAERKWVILVPQEKRRVEVARLCQQPR